MELTERKRLIIGEIVKAHIETGEPIGSKILASRIPNAPSTATLRNEMSELCEMGYLEQPHTSAGRLPTPKAYRLYVTELMPKKELAEDKKEIIESMLVDIKKDPETMGSSAAELLSEITGLPAISVSNTDMGNVLKRVNFLQMGRRAGIVFLVAADGRTKSRLVGCQSDIDTRLINLFERIAIEKVCNKDIDRLDMAYLQSMVVSSGIDALTLAPLFSCVFEMAKELKMGQINMGGAANIFSLYPTDIQARKILDLFSAREVVNNILSGTTLPIEVVFGDDTEYAALKPTGMVVASYGNSNNYGKIAVIGPTRMSYDSILPSVEYVASRVGQMMTEVLKGLEE